MNLVSKIKVDYVLTYVIPNNHPNLLFTFTILTGIEIVINSLKDASEEIIYNIHLRNLKCHKNYVKISRIRHSVKRSRLTRLNFRLESLEPL